MTISSAILGLQQSGKSMLLARLAGQEFINDYQSTSGFDYRCVTLKNNNKEINLRIWDISGAEMYIPTGKAQARNKDIYYFVIDPTQDIEPQIHYFTHFLGPEHIKQGSVCNLVITKSDVYKIDEKFSVNLGKIIELKQVLINQFQLKCEMIEISAKDNIGIESLKTLTVRQYSAITAEKKTSKDVSYIQLYKNLSAVANMEEHKQDRDKALSIFEEQLTLAGDDLDQIQKLITVSEPFINRHRHPDRDFIFRKKITNTWSECLRKARAQALVVLQNKVDTRDESVTEEILYFWKTKSLFAAHRNNSIFKGAFGNTKAQNEIEDLIWDMKFR
jgi:small GTP-binding protein